MRRALLVLMAAVAAHAAAGCKSAARETAEARFEQADEWFKISKYTEAKGLYKEALDLMQGDYPEAALGLANTYRELCKIESMRYVDGKEENGIDVRRVQSYYTEAERFFLWALEKRPGYRDAYYGLGLLYFETAVSKTIAASICRSDAERLDYRWRKLEATRDRFEKAYELDSAPKSGAPQEYLAQIYNLLGIEVALRNDLNGAAECFEKSYASADLYIAWVRYQMRPKMDPKLFDFFEKRIRDFEDLKSDLDMSLATLHGRLAGLNVRGGDAEGAILSCQKSRVCCDRYLAWLRKQPTPAAEPTFKETRAKKINEVKAAVDKILTDLGRPPAPEPSAPTAKP
jgi:tetratricopeptide (TPR) repeat protein